jgi:hypothetical protein
VNATVAVTVVALAAVEESVAVTQVGEVAATTAGQEVVTGVTSEIVWKSPAAETVAAPRVRPLMVNVCAPAARTAPPTLHTAAPLFHDPVKVTPPVIEEPGLHTTVPTVPTGKVSFRKPFRWTALVEVKATLATTSVAPVWYDDNVYVVLVVVLAATMAGKAGVTGVTSAEVSMEPEAVATAVGLVIPAKTTVVAPVGIGAVAERVQTIASEEMPAQVAVGVVPALGVIVTVAGPVSVVPAGNLTVKVPVLAGTWVVAVKVTVTDALAEAVTEENS